MRAGQRRVGQPDQGATGRLSVPGQQADAAAEPDRAARREPRHPHL